MRTLSAAAPLLGLAGLLAACSSGGGTATPAPATPAPATSAPATSAPATDSPASEAPTPTPGDAAPGSAGVTIADTPLGAVLADGNGLTLYVFLPDNAGPSTCYDGCASAWPPLLADGTPALGDGLAAGDFGTTTRTDGGNQVTFLGWPLYGFGGDKAAGDTTGQGLNDKWYVVGPDGTLIGAPSASDDKLQY